MEIFKYSKEDYKNWQFLFNRQINIIEDIANQDFINCIGLLKLNSELPSFTQISDRLKNSTGWEITPVNGLIHRSVFFNHLKNKQFPVTWWLRKTKDLDYIEEPDLFHDLFGHVPLLMNKDYAYFMEKYGQTALQILSFNNSEDLLKMFTKLYWWTIEYGLINNKIYGAGILSSFKETQRLKKYLLAKNQSSGFEIKEFNLEKVIKTEFDYTNMQPIYFKINNFNELDKYIDNFLEIHCN